MGQSFCDFCEEYIYNCDGINIVTDRGEKFYCWERCFETLCAKGCLVRGERIEPAEDEESEKNPQCHFSESKGHWVNYPFQFKWKMTPEYDILEFKQLQREFLNVRERYLELREILRDLKPKIDELRAKKHSKAQFTLLS
jgi:hypothetical protein